MHRVEQPHVPVAGLRPTPAPDAPFRRGGRTHGAHQHAGQTAGARGALDGDEPRTDEERAIEWGYLKALAEVDAGVDFGITDAELLGKNAAERRDYWEHRYRAESKLIKSELAAEHKLTEEELELLLDRVLAWKYGLDKHSE